MSTFHRVPYQPKKKKKKKTSGLADYSKCYCDIQAHLNMPLYSNYNKETPHHSRFINVFTDCVDLPVMTHQPLTPSTLHINNLHLKNCMNRTWKKT